MVQKLEDIKGGGGSIKLGTTGTISSLMTRELSSIKPAPAPQTPSGSFKHKSQTIPVSVACGSAATPKRLQQLRKSMDGASTSGSSNSMSHRSPQTGLSQKTKGFPRYSHQVPMLGSDNTALDRTPSRQKHDKKRVSNIVEVVDIKCGNPDRAWASPITNRLKKLGFSKLSESII
ncbi:hypothetical protein PTKIN_Ptkin14bG0054000 [Pterospermum kingtungense]